MVTMITIVNVLKFQTLYSVPFWPKFCFFMQCFLSSQRVVKAKLQSYFADLQFISIGSILCILLRSSKRISTCLLLHFVFSWSVVIYLWKLSCILAKY